MPIQNAIFTSEGKALRITGRETLTDIYDVRDDYIKLAGGGVAVAIHKTSGIKRSVRRIARNCQKIKEEQILREISALTQLDHPNILKVHEVYSDIESWHLVTEYLPMDFFGFLKQKDITISEDIIAKMMGQLFSALAYCHQRKIIHRDINLENLYVVSCSDEDITIKVSGFSSAICYQSDIDSCRVMNEGMPDYKAPEFFEKGSAITDKVDMWSCGVIMFMLLFGRKPFGQGKPSEIIQRIKTRSVIVPDSYETASQEARELLENLLVADKNVRLSATQAFVHKFIRLTAYPRVNPATASMIMNQLKSYNQELFMQNAALEFIVSRIAEAKDYEEQKKLFESLDKNKDGRLSKAELIAGYKNLYGDTNNIEKIVDEIMEVADKDKSGYVDYSEFLASTCNKKKLLTRAHLEKAFRLFDRDNSGTVTTDELKFMMGLQGIKEGQSLESLVHKADKNKDGQLNYAEFEQLMIELANK